MTHVDPAGRPHSLYSRSLFFSRSPLLLLLSYFLLCLGRTAADYDAVENHGGAGGLWCHDLRRSTIVMPRSSPQHKQFSGRFVLDVCLC